MKEIDMVDEIHHPHDKDFKFKYKCMGLKIHNYLHGTNYENIEFLDTEEAETGRRKDLVYILDGTDSFHVEHDSTPITPDKVDRFYQYNQHIVCDKSIHIDSVHTFCICTAIPENTIISKEINSNYTFKLPVFSTKSIDGAKVLSSLKDKVRNGIELTDNDQAELLFLFDSDIDMSVKSLAFEIAQIIRCANISPEDYKKLITCNMQTFKRFFDGDELSEMVSLLQKQTEDRKIVAIVEKYGMGFDEVYKDGKYEGRLEGKLEGKLEDAKNFLARGIDEEIISQCTGISHEQIKKIKKEL